MMKRPEEVEAETSKAGEKSRNIVAGRMRLPLPLLLLLLLGVVCVTWNWIGLENRLWCYLQAINLTAS